MEKMMVQIVEEGIRIPRNMINDLGKRFYDKGDVISLPTDEARSLVSMGRAIYSDGKESIKTVIDARDYHTIKREYDQLKRDYEALKGDYDSLVDDYESALTVIRGDDGNETEEASKTARPVKPTKPVKPSKG